eukprot:4129478-Pyramimonas_sp.AAC.1
MILQHLRESAAVPGCGRAEQLGPDAGLSRGVGADVGVPVAAHDVLGAGRDHLLQLPEVLQELVPHCAGRRARRLVAGGEDDLPPVDGHGD